MAVRFIIGGPGSGKTKRVYDEIISESVKNPDKNYILIVPDQYTLSSQLRVCELHPDNAAINIDVYSFDRLSYYLSSELGIRIHNDKLNICETLLLKKVIYEQKKNLLVYQNKADMMGFAGQIRTQLSEFSQYNIDEKAYEQLLKDTEDMPLLHAKIEDIKTISDAMKKASEGRYESKDEVFRRAISLISKSDIIKNSYIYFDGFTGFTPIQYEAVRELIKYSKGVTVSVMLGAGEYPVKYASDHELYSLSKNTILKVKKIANDENKPLDEDVFLNKDFRHENNKGLKYLCENLFEKGKREKYNEDCDGIEILNCDNPREECDYIVSKICELVREKGYRYKDIAVVSGNLSEYSRYLRESMDLLDIPAFIDNRRAILDNPIMDTLSALLDIVESNFSFNSVFHYLKRYFTNVSEYEIHMLENYCLAAGIKGKKAWENDFYKKVLYTDEGLEEINRIRKCVYYPIEKVWKVIKDRKTTVKDITNALYNYCIEMDFQEKAEKLRIDFEEQGDMYLSFEYSSVYKILMELFDTLVSLLGEEKCGAKKYNELFKEGLKGISIGQIPNAYDQVIVGDIERSRVDEIKALFVCGMNEDYVLNTGSGNSIISEQDRRYIFEKNIEVAPDERMNVFIKKFYILNTLAKPSERLFISYANVSQSGGTLIPSQVISNIKDICPGVKIVDVATDNKSSYFDLSKAYNPKITRKMLANRVDTINELMNIRGENEEVIKLYQTWTSVFNVCSQLDDEEKCRMILNGPSFWKHDDDIDSGVANDLFALKNKIGITGYERWAECPYKEFAKGGLGILSRGQYEVNSIAIGNLYHDTLEEFSKILKEKGITWHELNDDVRNDSLVEAVERVACKRENLGVFKEDAKGSFKMKRIIDAVGEVTKNIEYQVKKGKFEPAFFEYPVERGRVDRVDIYEEDDKIYFRIIDYKSGKVGFDLSKVYYNLQLQLLAYMNDVKKSLQKIYKDKEIIPTGAYYYHVDEEEYIDRKDVLTDGALDLGKIRKKRASKCKLSGETLNELDVILFNDEDLSNEGENSEVIEVKRNKKGGTFGAGSKILSNVDLSLLREYTEESINRLNNEMFTGCIKRNPYMEKDGDSKNAKTGCTYCDYRSVCRFKPMYNKNDSYNKMTVKSDDVIDTIREEKNGDKVD